MDVIEGVLVGPAGSLQELTCHDCGGLVKWVWRERKGEWQSKHRCDHQDTRTDYVARPVVFAVERVEGVGDVVEPRLALTDGAGDDTAHDEALAEIAGPIEKGGTGGE